MGENTKDLISQEIRQSLSQLFSDLPSEQTILIEHIKNKILSNVSKYTRMADFMRPAKKVEDIFVKQAAHYSEDEQLVLKRALIGKLALNLPVLVSKMKLPESILVLYPDALGRLADFLENSCTGPYDSAGDFFCKDIRFVLGLSIPCGAMWLDMTSRVKMSSVILSFFRSKDLNCIIQYIRARGYGPWFRGHVETRNLAGFNERGAQDSYFRLVELLERHKDIMGYVGSGWFFDPKLLEISQNLTFLRYPLDYGAFLLRHGTKNSDIEKAIYKSEKRRRLYQDGEYIPVCYSRLWPRRDLIAWAEHVKQRECL